MTEIKLQGYRRGSRFGIRNHIIIMSSVSCVNSFVQQAAIMDKSIIPITHQHGCDHIGKDREQVLRTLVGVCNNPNVGGILLIGLGCENITVDNISEKVNTEGKILKKIIVQEIGKKEDLFDLIKKYINEIKEVVSKHEKEEFNISKLIIGLECGGSDAFTGITANPSVGKVSDKLVGYGSTVVLSEIPEMIGAKNALKEIIEDESVREKLFSRIDYYIKVSKDCGCDLIGVNPTPGNIKGGISSIEEKSLGCIAKAGTSKIKEFVDYATAPESNGLVVMDTPGNDAESITGISAGGANLILFTTGLGTPLGSPIMPVIKISSNTKTFKNMRDFIDVDAGKIIDGTSLDDVSEEIFSFLIEVSNGKQTVSEINKSWEFSINRIGPTF
jgi:altronate dehydratase large subunit